VYPVEKILAVDDNLLIIKLIKLALYQEYEVITATNGKEAVEIAKREKPDLIIMDIMMPVMDGIEAARAVKEDQRTKGIPVLLLTAYGGNEPMTAGLDAGADDFIEKPFEPEALRARVRAHLRAKALFDSLEQMGRDREMIADIMKDTTSSLDIYKVLYTITKKAAGYLNLFRCSIIRIEKEKDYGVVIASSDDPEIGGLCIRLDKYPEIRMALKTFDILVVDDIQSDPIMAEASVPHSLRSIMLVPLIYKDELIGTMFLKGDSTKKGFSEREADLARMIADSAVNAIRNAFTYEELKKNRDELEESNRKLMELDKLKSGFLAMAAHEFRSPLSVINGYLEMMKEGAAGPLSEKAMKFLALALESGTALSRTVEEVLDLSVIESGKLNLRLKERDIVKTVGKVLSLMGKAFEEKGIEVRFPVREVKAVFDRDKVEQVMINLLSNALKFTSACGTITVDIKETDSEATIMVSDTGCGIPPEDLNLVFDEFYKGRSREKGAGLGLSICKKLVEMHGGRIWAESKEGEGSSFHFTLPKGGRPQA
jgi:signal transduction histidine kinase/CheY-like chemotaxis protein